MTEVLDATKPREGNLRLCECGHLKVFHFRRPQWYQGPLGEKASCAHCGPGQCDGFNQAADQRFRFLPQEKEY